MLLNPCYTATWESTTFLCYQIIVHTDITPQSKLYWKLWSSDTGVVSSDTKFTNNDIWLASNENGFINTDIRLTTIDSGPVLNLKHNWYILYWSVLTPDWPVLTPKKRVHYIFHIMIRSRYSTTAVVSQ